LKTFEELGLAEPILRALKAEGYTAPTPIQADIVPLLLSGRDVLGVAQTGTGKTASFVLPLIQWIGEADAPTGARTCRSLILAPTRELAAQIADEIRRYTRFSPLTVAVVVGGVKPGPQVRSLARGVDILVATPGRLLDHLSSGAVDLGRTRRVVLDEADQMLDLGFMPAIRRILAKTPRQRQTALLSATMPDEIRRLAEQFQTDPAEVAVAPVSRPIEQIEQRVIEAERDEKCRVLVDLLSDRDVTRAIVFTRTKHGADKVARRLESAGYAAGAIHGNKSQSQRTRALEAFRSSRAPILVATDIAARGIHVSDVSHVINYDLPDVPEAYVHRIGRTGRAGQAGVAISLCGREERKLLKAIERLTGMTLGRGTSSARAGTDDREPAAGPAREAGARKPRGGGAQARQKTTARGGARRRGQGPRPHREDGAGRAIA
jgi:ATP-dependent RNA helicase RhlE